MALILDYSVFFYFGKQRIEKEMYSLNIHYLFWELRNFKIN